MLHGAHSTTPARQPAWRWAVGIGLPILGALVLVIWGFAIVAWGPLAGIVPALTCLVAGWLLRSWLGFAVTSVVYVVAGGGMWILAGGGGLNAEYVWAIVLPGVALAALGTVLGMYLSRSQ